ncbi:MAG: hypothetical protein AUK47_16235 [Deltaproteobacteria bacterium CG2_30_63_29]|nr:MAG: hypothetical protein AUK47_16235 [Deltaproteobacteria bacterium CG2_30_63_29]
MKRDDLRKTYIDGLGAINAPVTAMADFQAWFFDALVGPHRSKGMRQATQERIKAEVRPSAELRAEERIGIYSDRFKEHMVLALQADYPGLRLLLGELPFTGLCMEYLDRFPSVEFSLNHLGRKLPAFLARTQREGRELLIDLTRTELALCELRDEPEVDLLDTTTLANIPDDAWPETRFVTIPAIRLLEHSYPIVPLLDALEKGQSPPLKPRPSWTVAWRKNFENHRRELTELAFLVLTSLAEGLSLEHTLESAAEVWEGAPDQMQTQIFQWFSEWVEDGLFASVRLPY